MKKKDRQFQLVNSLAKKMAFESLDNFDKVIYKNTANKIIKKEYIEIHGEEDLSNDPLFLLRLDQKKYELCWQDLDIKERRSFLSKALSKVVMENIKY